MHWPLLPICRREFRQPRPSLRSSAASRRLWAVQNEHRPGRQTRGFGSRSKELVSFEKKVVKGHSKFESGKSEFCAVPTKEENLL